MATHSIYAKIVDEMYGNLIPGIFLSKREIEGFLRSLAHHMIKKFKMGQTVRVTDIGIFTWTSENKIKFVPYGLLKQFLEESNATNDHRESEQDPQTKFYFGI